jgi:hypothetical protein
MWHPIISPICVPSFTHVYVLKKDIQTVFDIIEAELLMQSTEATNVISQKDKCRISTSSMLSYSILTDISALDTECTTNRILSVSGHDINILSDTILIDFNRYTTDSMFHIVFFARMCTAIQHYIQKRNGFFDIMDDRINIYEYFLSRCVMYKNWNFVDTMIKYKTFQSPMYQTLRFGT